MDAAVLFDFGGTLDADGVAWKERFYRLYADEGVRIERVEFDPIFYRADDSLVGRIPATHSFEDTVAELARRVTRALRPDEPSMAERIARRFVQSTQAQIARNRPVLRRLASRYQLGIVSNFYGNLATVCDNLAVRPFFSVIVDSTDVGFSKPDPRIFRKAIEDLGVPPAAAVFVGDSLARDMAGARAVGMRHVWLVEASAPCGAPCCPDDRVARSLEEVEAWL